jgi:hypothetical protein
MLLALLAPALACPTVATGTPAPLSFDTAVVAIVREGERTTFSVAINPLGDRQSFALVLPVPEVLEESEIHTLDAGLFAMLDGWTAPRHVSDAGCANGAGGEADADTDADADADADAPDDASVDVEAEYLVGEYAITILSAEESGALGTWLDTNGYYLPDGAEPRLAEYIEGGSYFLAAKVAASAELADGTPLSPLQVAYDSPVFSIPIRLATLNSPGEQDMVIYAITPEEDGRVGISNYPEFEVPDQCRWGSVGRGDDFATFYDGVYTEAWSAMGDAGWAVEFAGGPSDCNPCTDVSPEDEDLLALGFTGSVWDAHGTRIHMRYTPEQADEDLMLYASRMWTTVVTSYADDVEWNACIDSCFDLPDTPAYDLGDDPEVEADASCGCASPGSPGLLAGVIALTGLAGRLARARGRGTVS